MEDLKLARNQTPETKEAVVDLDVLEVKEIKSVPKTVEVRAKIDIEFYFGDIRLVTSLLINLHE